MIAIHPILKYRRAAGLTQVELAQKVGVAFQTLNAWEKGANPRPRHIAKLATVLGVEPLQLINEIETWNKEEKPAT